MEKCTNCKIKYPDGYTQPIFTSDGNQDQVCGVCALEISNAVLGINRKKFDGTNAEHLRQKAISFRKTLVP